MNQLGRRVSLDGPVHFSYFPRNSSESIKMIRAMRWIYSSGLLKRPSDYPPACVGPTSTLLARQITRKMYFYFAGGLVGDDYLARSSLPF